MKTIMIVIAVGGGLWGCGQDVAVTTQEFDDREACVTAARATMAAGNSMLNGYRLDANCMPKETRQ